MTNSDQIDWSELGNGDLERLYFSRVDGAVSSDLEGETVILSLDSGIYFGLDGVGSEIWHLLDARRTVNTIVGQLRREFRVTEERCQEDVLNFLRELERKNLIKVDDTAIESR